MSFLLDADICSASMRGNKLVDNRFIQYSGRLYLSTVVLGELYAWVLRARASPKLMKSLLRVLQDVQLLHIDDMVARKFGEMRAWQLDQGTLSPDLDLLNAAVALVHNFTLVTHNTKDYVNVPGLALDDWLVP